MNSRQAVARRRRSKGTEIVCASKQALIWCERSLLAIGIVTLGWCARVVSEAWLIQRAALSVLEQRAALHPITSVPSGVATIARGTPLAQLQVPRIGLSAVVLEGDDDRTLRLGPGHIAGTAMPGEEGNIAIAGHRDTFFRPLRNIRRGDEIVLVVGQGRFQYRVSSLRVVTPDDLGVLAPTGHSSLTLVTCYPFSMFGHAPERFIVRADLVENTAHTGRRSQIDRTVHATART